MKAEVVMSIPKNYVICTFFKKICLKVKVNYRTSVNRRPGLRTSGSHTPKANSCPQPQWPLASKEFRGIVAYLVEIRGCEAKFVLMPDLLLLPAHCAQGMP